MIILKKIKYWSLDIDYVMFIEENGNSGSIQDIYKKILSKKTVGIDERYFTITGCIFEKHNYSLMRNNIRKLKYWQNGFYFNPKWYGGHSSTFAGLEIADLYSYPIHQYVKYQKENLSFQTIKPKLHGFPDYKNKGLKIFP